MRVDLEGPPQAPRWGSSNAMILALPTANPLFHATTLPLTGIITPESHSTILLGHGNSSKGKFLRWKVLFIP